MAQHNLDDCPQAPTIERMDRTLERVALALEQIAQHTVMVQAHEKRLDVHDEDFREAFERIRTIEDKHLREAGASAVIKRQTKFWDGVRQQITPYAIAGLLFLFWLLDKFDIVQRTVKLWKEAMK